MATPTAAAIDGWFTVDTDQPHLLGTRCSTCGTTFFPREEQMCRNPSCDGTEFEEVELSRTGTVWSYTNAAYQPPDPYIPTTDPYEPFAIAAVRLAAEEMVVLGQVVEGVGVEDLHTGMEMELALETLYTEDGTDHLVWKWRPTDDTARAADAEETAR
jgi:uncharacterized OB-fold protein